MTESTIRSAARPAAATTSVAAALAGAMALLLPGCAESVVSCDGDDECAAMCDSEQAGECTAGTCECSSDVPLGDVGQHSDLAVAAGQAWVSAYAGRYGDLLVARWDGDGRIAPPSWEFVDGVPDGPVELPDSTIRRGILEPGDDVGLYTSIGVAPSGAAIVSYHDQTHASLKLATHAGDGWQLQVVDAGTPGTGPGTAIVGRYSALTLTADGRPGIAYFAESFAKDGSIQTELRFAQAAVAAPASSADWTRYLVDSLVIPPPAEGDKDAAPPAVPRGVGLFVAAARAADGSPVLAYYDSEHGDLKLARFDAAAQAFSPALLDGAADDVGWYPSVAIDAAGVAHVSYVIPGAHRLLYINDAERARETIDGGYRQDGQTSDGIPQPVFHFVGDDSSLVLTAGGPAVAYQDATAHALLLARRTGSAVWEPQVVAPEEAGGHGFYASAEYDAGQVVISDWVLDRSESASWVEIHRARMP